MFNKRIAGKISVALIALSLAGVASAEDKPVVDELLIDRLVEKGVLNQEEAASIRAEAAIKEQDAAAAKKKFSVQGKTKIDLGGYVQAQYVNDASAKDEFKVRRARLDLRGNLSNVGWRLQVDAVQPLKDVVTTVGPPSKTTKVVTRPILLDAYLDYNFDTYASVRVGQFKLPFGRENLESSPNLDTINRSQVTEKLVPGRDIGSQGRDIGAQVSGSYDFGGDRKIVDYAVGVFNGAGVNVGEDNKRKDVGARVVVYPIKGLGLGLAHYNGRTGSAGDVEKIRTGAEVTYAVDALTLKGEYVLGNDGVTDKYGWYAQAGYRFFNDYEAVVKYDSYDPNKDASGDRTDVTTAGLNWFVNKYAKIQANYEWKTEEGTKVDNNVFLTQFTAQF